jgi:glyoxylate/hydroxypyruvate reductase A
MVSIVFKAGAGNPQGWQRELSTRLPDLDWRVWPDVGDPATVDFVLAFKVEPGFFAQFPNLKGILATGAGVDGLFADPAIPTHLPIARIVDPYMTQQMVQWAAYGVLHFFRRFDEYRDLQAKSTWQELGSPTRHPNRVGVLGFGEIGGAIGRGLLALGFFVNGWTRSPRDLGPIVNYAGMDQLDRFLADSPFLICSLPLTPDTKGLLNRERLSKLPKNAVVLNLARGSHVVTDDLLALLNDGHLAGAVLDVTDPEPLPPAHPLWQHQNVIITPHEAGLTTPETAAGQVAANIKHILAGEPLENPVDVTRGY